MLPKFDYVRPGSISDAVRALSDGNARVHAGGTDLLGCLHDGVFEADRIVSLRELDGLRGIGPTTDGGLRIGARTTIAEIHASQIVRRRFPGLARAAGDVASPQLRNQGTLGGNLCQRPRCWYFRGEFDCAKKGGEQCFAVDGENRYHAILGGGPCFIVHPSDTAPMLLALGAAVRIVGPGGERTVPLEGFFALPEKDLRRENVLEPGEILTEVLIPKLPPDLKTSYLKIRERGAWDFALASVALAVTLDGRRLTGVRVAFGGVAPIPWRARSVEEVLGGNVLDERIIARAADAAVADAVPLEQNGYKMPLLRGAVERALVALVQ